MSVNLNEFSVEEINELITVIEEKQSDLMYKSAQLSDRFLESSEIRNDLFIEYKRSYDILILWETQLRNALAEIVKRETTQSN